MSVSSQTSDFSHEAYRLGQALTYVNRIHRHHGLPRIGPAIRVGLHHLRTRHPEQQCPVAQYDYPKNRIDHTSFTNKFGAVSSVPLESSLCLTELSNAVHISIQGTISDLFGHASRLTSNRGGVVAESRSNSVDMKPRTPNDPDSTCRHRGVLLRQLLPHVQKQEQKEKTRQQGAALRPPSIG